MKLVEIEKDFTIDYGAPCPVLLANDDSQLRLFFHNHPHNNNRIELRFISSSFFSFSPPNDEALNGHPYFEFSLTPGGFFELLDSDLITKVKSYNRYHPYNNPNAYDGNHHYLITFKEQLFECIAAGYEVIAHGDKSHEVATALINEWLNPPIR